MFTHLLVPIGNKEIVKKSVKYIAKLAQTDSAQITFVHVSNPNPPYMYADDMFGYGVSQSNHKKSCQDYADYLFSLAVKKINNQASAQMSHIFNVNISEGILDAAKKNKVDAIVMASHKRAGLAGWVMGSETQSVINHTKIPVIVI